MAKRIEHSSHKARTVLGGETQFNGRLRFQESLKIDSRFEGSIESTGFLIVEAGAVVIADIKVGTLIVGGTIQGDVTADERLEVLAGGNIIGNIRCPNLVMAEGTGIQGSCEMLADPAAINIFALPLDRLKKTVTRVG